MHSLRAAEVILAATVATVAQAADAPLAYDSADGPAGPADAIVSGTNFGAWQSQNDDLTTYRFGAGLAYGGLQTAGNAVYGGGAYQSAGVPVTTGAAEFGPFRSGGSLGADNTTLWASALVNNLTGYDGLTFSLHNDSTAWAQGSGVRVFSQGGYWQLGDGTQTINTGVKVEGGVPTLMVLKSEFAATSDRATLYINPTPGAALPQAGTTLTSSNLSFRSARFYAGNGSRFAAIDELRVGSSFASVTPHDPAAAPVPQKRIRAYFIGNSVTDTINYEALRRTALSAGQMMPASRHVNLGSPLTTIISNPTAGYTEAPYGGWANALPNFTWDAVSIQPFDRQLASDKDSVQTLINKTLENPQNSQTEFLIYSRWPRRENDGSLNYQARWLQDYNPAGGAWLQEESQDYFQTLTNEVRAANPGKTVRLVPVGDVLNQIDLLMESGEFGPSFGDIVDVYSDGIHFNKYGSFIVGMTYYATLFKSSPEGLPYVEYGLSEADAAYASQVQSVAWDVVRTHPYAMVPEPGSLVLVWGGIAMLGRRRCDSSRDAGR